MAIKMAHDDRVVGYAYTQYLSDYMDRHYNRGLKKGVQFQYFTHDLTGERKFAITHGGKVAAAVMFDEGFKEYQAFDKLTEMSELIAVQLLLTKFALAEREDIGPGKLWTLNHIPRDVITINLPKQRSKR